MPPTAIRPGHENCQDLRSLRILPYDPTPTFQCSVAPLVRFVLVRIYKPIRPTVSNRTTVKVQATICRDSHVALH